MMDYCYNYCQRKTVKTHVSILLLLLNNLKNLQILSYKQFNCYFVKMRSAMCIETEKYVISLRGGHAK